MGFWGSVEVNFDVDYPEGTKPKWMTDEQKKELVLDFFQKFYPFSAYEGGMDFEANTMFNPTLDIRVRSEGELPTHEVLIAFGELFDKWHDLVYVDHACVIEHWDCSSDETVFYFSKENGTVLIESEVYDIYDTMGEVSEEMEKEEED